jgi:hypothetical protein
MRVLTYVLVAAVFVGCSSSAMPEANIMSSAGGNGFLRAAAMTPPLDRKLGGFYVSTMGENEQIEYYAAPRANEHPMPQCRGGYIYAGATDVDIDNNGNVWAPSGSLSGGSTVVFAPKCGEPFSVLNITGLGQPYQVAFDRLNHAYVLLDYIGSKILRTIVRNTPHTGNAYGMVIDKDGDIFLNTNGYVHSHGNVVGHPVNCCVIEYRSGRSRETYTGIRNTGGAAGLAMDRQGNLIVMQSGGGGRDEIRIYKKPYGPSDLLTTIYSPGNFVFCKLNAAETFFACANQSANSVDIYNYDASDPRKVKYQYSWFPDAPIAAVSPSEPYRPY